MTTLPRIAAPILALTLAAGPAAAAEEDGAALWARLVELAERAPRMAPGEVHTRTETLDKDGAVKGVEDVWLTMASGADGQLVSTLVRAEQDGVDVTDKARRKEEREDGKQFELGPESSPFLPENQDRVTATPLSERREYDGYSCRGFDVTVTTDETTYTGVAWIDEVTALPRRYQYRADPMPPLVQEMQVELTFRPRYQGGWTSQQMVVEGVGGVLIVQKRFRVTISFSDHFVME